MLRSRSRDAAAMPQPEPSFMSHEQLGQTVPASSAFLRSPLSKLSSQRRASRTQDSQQDFTASYLHELRNNRPLRPGGARPLPGYNDSHKPRIDSELPPRAESAMGRPYHAPVEWNALPDRSASAVGHRHLQSSAQRQEGAGRPVARQPDAPPPTRDFSQHTSKSVVTAGSSSATPDGSDLPYKYPYYERGQRWMERQETTSLSRALHDMDFQEQSRLHSKAQHEAAELVWKHQNPDKPYRNPDAGYRSHLRRGSHARSQSIGPFQELYVRKGGPAEGSRTASDGSSRSNGSREVSFGSNGSYGSTSSREQGGNNTVASRGRQLSDSMKERALSGLPFSMSKVRSLSRRRKSDRSSRKASDKSSKSLFQNPDDQIWEETEDTAEPTTIQPKLDNMPLRDRPRNTSYGSREVGSAHVPGSKPSGPRSSIINIHQSLPSQSNNGSYMRNAHMHTTKPSSKKPIKTPEPEEALEIRGDDIRAATSMKRKDRSPNLPMPSTVSDRPGRPIVSFEPQFKPRPISMKEEQSKAAPIPIISLEGAEVTPSISISEVPLVHVNSVLSIAVERSAKAPKGPIPTISMGESQPKRPLPHVGRQSGLCETYHQSSSQGNRTDGGAASHWSPSSWPIRTQAQCANCALGISGKVVSASGERFHPDCFTCFQCGEHLECVAFYPEPERFRTERVARIEARIYGMPIPESQAHFTEMDDGDSGLRFYCHLDFHEKFSPRCRNCKTPIEGKVIIACGGEWHEGHFFCAECGDPFDQTTPFVEKDGYAWCVGCHTGRFSGKCAGCRKPIVETVINALGKEWHEDCFACGECGGKFEDGRFFTRAEGDAPVCVKCEERRLKA